MRNDKYILILGGYGYGNTGDEAQLNESIKLMNNNFKDYDIIVLTPNIEYTKKSHNIENADLAPREAFFNSKSPDTIYWIKNKKEEKLMIKRMKKIYTLALLKKYFRVKIKDEKIERLISLIKDADLVYYSGGGYLTGMTLSRLFDGCLFISICKLFKVPVVLSGQTIGLFRNNFDKRISKRAFNYAKIITLRDPEESPKALESIGIKNYQVMFDDALFCDKWENENDINDLLKYAGIKEKDFICFQMHFWGVKTQEDKIKLLDNLKYCIKIIKNTFKNIPILLFPMVESDYREEMEFLDFLNGEENIFLLKYDYDFRKIRAIISKSLFCITMKHHPIIFAIGEKKPVISLAYSKYYIHKNEGALKIFGLEKYNINIEDKDFENIFAQRLNSINKNYNLITKELDDTFKIQVKKKEDFVEKVKRLLK